MNFLGLFRIISRKMTKRSNYDQILDVESHVIFQCLHEDYSIRIKQVSQCRFGDTWKDSLELITQSSFI